MMKSASVEKTVREIWSDILQNRTIKPQSDFFDMGGDSIMALNMLFEVSSVLEVEIPPGVLFDHSTFSGFMAIVQDCVTASAAVITKD